MSRYSRISFISQDAGAQGVGGLLARIVGLLIGTAAFVAAVFVGAVFLAGAVGFVLIGSVLLMLRAWWLRRELYKSVKGSGDLDGEYTVIHQEEVKTTTEHKRRN